MKKSDDKLMRLIATSPSRTLKSKFIIKDGNTNNKNIVGSGGRATAEQTTNVGDKNCNTNTN